jgi:hypothetical protein
MEKWNLERPFEQLCVKLFLINFILIEFVNFLGG